MSPPQRILVTGAAGFVGSNLVDRLLADGRRVVGVDSFDSFYPEEQKRRNLSSAVQSPDFQLVRADIRDGGALQRLFRQERFDAVAHLAALAGVRPSLERPAAYSDVNVHGTGVVLETAAHHGCARIVLASSSSVYGEREDGPFRETDPVTRPISPYAATKRAAELVAHAFHHAFGQSITCARIFTAYGPRQRPDLAIRKFAECMLDGKSLPVFGDGHSLRDFTYIDDLIEGLVRALDRDLAYSILNLGSGHKTSILEVVGLLEENLGCPAKIEWLPAQTGDVRRTWSDITAAREALGFEPRIPIEEGLALFTEWLRCAR